MPQRNETEKIKEVAVTTETKPESRQYWARASKHTLGNFQKEVKREGRIDVPEASLEFSDHTYSTDDPKTIAFIESHPAFVNGAVRRIKDKKELQNLFLQLASRKQVREITSTDDNVSVSPVEITKAATV